MSTKLAYIVAAGHSGSTLLDLLVGSIPGGFSAGEFNYLPWQISRRECAGPRARPQKLCSCGRGFGECSTWRRVIEELSERIGYDIYSDPLRFRMNLLQNERFHGRRFSGERINRALFSIAHRHGPLYPLAGLIGRLNATAVRNNWQIIDMIGEQLGRRFVVDSSKSAARLKLLGEHRPRDTFAVVLFRDIRGVAYSGYKLGRDPTTVAASWVRQYNDTWRILSRLPGLRLLCVRYEAMVTDPVAERRRIAAFLDESEPADVLSIDTRDLHLVAGNKIRYAGNINIRADAAWETGFDSDAITRIEAVRSGLLPDWGPYLDGSET